MFGLISVHAFAPFQSIRATSNVQIDVTRVASQVVVGVGFLGGGAILKYGPNVRGLTTAASIWVTAAIGLPSGVGYYWPAVTVTLPVLIALIGLRGFRRLVRRRIARRRERSRSRWRPARPRVRCSPRSTTGPTWRSGACGSTATTTARTS